MRCGGPAIEVEKQISPLRNSQRARVAAVEMTVVQVEMTVVQFVREKQKQRRWGRLRPTIPSAERSGWYPVGLLWDILRKKWGPPRAPHFCFDLDCITFFRWLRDHDHRAFHFL
jgi:hypothetical protein